jgi:hypothetical protein
MRSTSPRFIRRASLSANCRFTLPASAVMAPVLRMRQAAVLAGGAQLSGRRHHLAAIANRRVSRPRSGIRSPGESEALIAASDGFGRQALLWHRPGAPDWRSGHSPPSRVDPPGRSSQ